MEETKSKVCPNCNAEITEGQAFCTKCGKAVEVEKKNVCSKCGEELQENQEFCSKCGQKIGLTIETNVNSAINQFNETVNKVNAKNKKKPIIIVAICVAIVIIIAIAIASGKEKVNFKEVYNEIGGEGYYCVVASDNSYLKIDTNPSDIKDSFSSSAWSMIKKANSKLGFSASLDQKMLETRGIDGRQSDSNENVKVSWTYHPSKGIEVLYELVKK